MALPNVNVNATARQQSAVFGDRWQVAFGLQTESDLMHQRKRYEQLKRQLVFDVNAIHHGDPLTALLAISSSSPSASSFPPRSLFANDVVQTQSSIASNDLFTAASDHVEAGSTKLFSDSESDSDTDDAIFLTGTQQQQQQQEQPPNQWSQFFSDESLLHEINKDLERLYPNGNELLFQNDAALSVLRSILFVWCKLHPDVSYRQGMHDLAAVVLFAFLLHREIETCFGPGEIVGFDANQVVHVRLHNGAGMVYLAALPSADKDTAGSVNLSAEMWASIEADAFIVFEAVMLYAKPLYALHKPPSTSENSQSSTAANDEIEDLPHRHEAKRLFSDGTPFDLFGEQSAEAGAQQFTSGGYGRYGCSFVDLHRHGGNPYQLPLHRLCHMIQYELLREKDPQLHFHLRNLEILPETYCLRWLRLLFAREMPLAQVLELWDAMIQDPNRANIVYSPTSGLRSVSSTRSADDSSVSIPLIPSYENQKENDVIGFPLLPYLCIARLLELSPELRNGDSSACLRLLMRSPAGDDMQNIIAREAVHGADTHAKALVLRARILQDPMHEMQLEDNDSESVRVVQFGQGSLGLVLGVARSPHERRLVVKEFSRDAANPAGMGQAEASGHVQAGDLLESVNGTPIIDVTAEDIKRHIQLVSRPLFMGFRRIRRQEPESEIALSNSFTEEEPLAEPPETDDEAVWLDFLPGESCFAKIETSLQRFTLSSQGSLTSHFLSGKLYVTNYRCLFHRLLSRNTIDWQVPVLSIASVEGMDALKLDAFNTTSSSTSAIDQAQAVLGFGTPFSDHYNVLIRCKDTQVGCFSFSNYAEYAKLFKCLSCLVFPSSLLDAFCFAFSPVVAPSDEVPFDLREEYGRLGLLNCPGRLRCIDQSARYDLCPTYPQHLIVPAELNDLKLKAAAEFRSRSRLPVVCWMHPRNYATICRSSQPLVGMKSARCPEDEQLVRLLCISSSNASGHSYGSYMIMDARGQLAVVGNKAMGKGTEIPSNYRGSKLVFMNLENIHAVRQSFQQLIAIFEPRRNVGEDLSASYYTRLDSSGWLRHVRFVLKASIELAASVHNGTSVLTHCSDGWDRTSQMVALAEFMLDPFYRTLQGFQVLIEKEWCSFGHQFATRCGHGRSDANSEHRSPVFLLWLDCVWQFLRQFPTECEFNEHLLLALADHVSSCKYSTFMFDCEKQRKEYFAKYRAPSIWSELNSSNEIFLNACYAPNPDRCTVLFPNTLSKNIKLWKGYFCRWDPTCIPPVAAYQFY